MGAVASRAIVGPAAWLSAACAPVGEGARRPRLERRGGDGRMAALVEVRCAVGVASHVLVADAGAWQDLAVFEGRVEAMEWQGAELLLAFAAGSAMRVFSVFPGMRLRDAVAGDGLRWVRLSTRRSRR